MQVGDRVKLKTSDTVYPSAPATVVRISTFNARPYIGVEIGEDIETLTPEVGHVVWRYADDLE